MTRRILTLALTVLLGGCATIDTQPGAQSYSTSNPRLTPVVVIKAKIARLERENETYLTAAQDLQVENEQLKVLVATLGAQVDKLRSRLDADWRTRIGSYNFSSPSSSPNRYSGASSVQVGVDGSFSSGGTNVSIRTP